MATSLTPARQRNAVSQGAALGLSLHGRFEFAYDKIRIDLAFERAWRDWPSVTALAEIPH